jgi:hypothetical protein
MLQLPTIWITLGAENSRNGKWIDFIDHFNGKGSVRKVTGVTFLFFVACADVPFTKPPTKVYDSYQISLLSLEKMHPQFDPHSGAPRCVKK